MAILDLPDLRRQLQWAVEVEHATIPPYLCAMFSVLDTDSEAYRTFKFVVREEMLHVGLAANLLAAVGGTPRFTGTAVPSYPAPLPHHEPVPPLTLELGPADVDTVRDVFLRIEQPADPHAGPEPERFETLGQFYEAIIMAIRRLAPDAFADPRPQLTRGYAGHGGGALTAVTDLASAEFAVEQIVEQGEGSHRTKLEPFGFEGASELAHYWRFKRIVGGDVKVGEVHPMRRNSATGGLPLGPIRELSELFDAVYSLQLQVMERVWEEGDRSALIDTVMVPLMNHAQKPLALALLRSPWPEGSGDHAGPGFTWAPLPIQRMREITRGLTDRYDLGPTLETLELVATALDGG